MGGFFFTVKKVVSRLLFPVALIFYPLAIGVLLLWFGKTPRKQLLGKMWVTASLVLFVFFALGPTSGLMLRSLETRHAPFDPEKARAEFGADWSPGFVLVLSGDFTPLAGLPPSATVGPVTQARMSEGVRIHRLFPESKLVFTGGKIKETDPFTISSQMAALAEIWGVDPESIVLETESRDTKDHVRFLKEMVGPEPFVLVTSAAHLPRATAMFEHAGLKPVPAPTDFHSIGNVRLSWSWLVPRTGRLQDAENAFYEYMGLTLAKLRGQI